MIIRLLDVIFLIQCVVAAAVVETRVSIFFNPEKLAVFKDRDILNGDNHLIVHVNITLFTILFYNIDQLGRHVIQYRFIFTRDHHLALLIN